MSWQENCICLVARRNGVQLVDIVLQEVSAAPLDHAEKVFTAKRENLVKVLKAHKESRPGLSKSDVVAVILDMKNRKSI